MNIETLLSLELGSSVSVFNEPFTIAGRSEVMLEGDKEVVWLHDDERMLAIVPDDEELVLFVHIDDEMEPDGEMLLFQNKEYEFNYEDAGNVTATEGDAETEEGDRYLFVDYQSQEGRVVRILTNENTGDETSYEGQLVAEEDLTEL